MSWLKMLNGETEKEQPEMALTPTLTKQTLEQIIVHVDNDPLAGRGSLTKRDILVDRILAHVNSCVINSTPVQPRPILHNESQDVLELKKTAAK